jgi:hypothetical protein
MLRNRLPVKGENLQGPFVIYLNGLTKSESRRPPNREITGATTGVFGVPRVRAMKNPARFPGRAWTHRDTLPNVFVSGYWCSH